MQLAVKTYESLSKDRAAPRDIVLLHGTGARAEMWSRQISALQNAGYRCIVPDLRGHGETLEPKTEASLNAHIEDVMETLSQVDIVFPAPFVGHSLGAIISMSIAERDAALVDQVFAVSMPGRVPQLTRSAFKFFLGWPYHSLKNTPIHRRLSWRERVLLDTDHYTLNEIVRNFETIDYAAQVPQVIHCPVHFAVGRFDPIALCAHVEAMHKSLSNSTFHVFEFAAHNCMDTHPSQFNAWLLGYLNNQPHNEHSSRQDNN
jgi:pimeloyl-ACP methyl ester carboxylesterase